jgi:hypothetical protein
LEVAKRGKCENDVEGTRVHGRVFKFLCAELSNREGQLMANTGIAGTINGQYRGLAGDDVGFDGGSFETADCVES